MSIEHNKLTEGMTTAVGATIEGILFEEPLLLTGKNKVLVDWSSIQHSTASITLKEVGILYLSFPKTLMQAIVEMVTGGEATENQEEQEVDALCEVLNSIGGLLMRSLVGQNTIYKIGIPQIVTEEFNREFLLDLNYTVSDEKFSLAMELN